MPGVHPGSTGQCQNLGHPQTKLYQCSLEKISQCGSLDQKGLRNGGQKTAWITDDNLQLLSEADGEFPG